MNVENDNLYFQKLNKAQEALTGSDIPSGIRLLEEARSVNTTQWLNAEYLLVGVYEQNRNYYEAISVWKTILEKNIQYQDPIITPLKMIAFNYSNLPFPDAANSIEYFTQAIALMKKEVKNDPQVCEPYLGKLYWGRTNLYSKIGRQYLAEADMKKLKAGTY